MIGLVTFLEIKYAADGAAAVLTDRWLMSVLRLEIWTFFIVLLGVVVYKLVTGGINTKGLLYTTEGKKLEFSSARLQALIVTIGAAAYYLYLVLTTRDFPKFLGNDFYEFFGILGGSNLIFLAGKLWTVISDKFK
jgi:hypothetical protein